MSEGYSTTYESSTTATHSPGISFNAEYPRSIPGIIKIAEIVLSLITFICSIVRAWVGHSWVEFVAMSCFVSTLIYVILTLLNIVSFIRRYPGPWLLVEFIYCIIYAVFFLIAAIVCAAYASGLPNVGAAAFFGFAATAVFIVDTIYQYRAWSTSDSSMRTQTTTTSTTVTTTRDERPKY